MSKDYYDDDEENANLPDRQQQRYAARRGKPDSDRVGVVGAIVGGAFNAGIMALIMAIPGFNLPFITPAFAGITLALLAGPAATIMSSFMRIGYSGRFTKHLGKALESAASAWGLYSLWQHYPFAFSAVGLPAALDKWLPIGFAVLAGIGALSCLTHLIRMFGADRKSRRRPEIEDNDLED